MLGILGTKLGMTRLIQDDGRVIPITVINCEPNEITQLKTTEKDGYPAIVLGFLKLKKQTKTKKFKYVREFKIDEKEQEKYKQGDKITVEIVELDKEVKITSISKGKGFQGVMKRYNFHSGPGGHGSHHHREPGSVGCRAKPGRVHRGKKLPGRMGGDRWTLKTQIKHIDSSKNIIALKGPVPGPIGGLVIINRAEA